MSPTLRSDGGNSKKGKRYGDKLRRVKLGALFATTLHGLNRFLGFCALTWATAVILGGFVSELTKKDFYSTSILLVLEGLRLAAAVLFSNLVTRKLVTETCDPEKIKYNDFRRQILVQIFRTLDQTFQLTVVATSFVVSLRRLFDLRGDFGGISFDALHDSLRIFYGFVLVNSIIAAIAVVHANTITVFYLTSYDLRRFYDSIVWTGIQIGLLQANDIDFVSFAMSTQADEYRRNLRPPVVYALYKDVINHLYNHEKGFEAVCSALDSGDIYEKEAAANMVGLWAKSERGRKDKSRNSRKRVLFLHTSLISKLAGAIRDDKTGRAATSSFVSLAKLDRKEVTKVKSESGELLTEIVINSIARVVSAEKHKRALVYMKLLIELLKDEIFREEMEEEKRNWLIRDLTVVFEEESGLRRTKAIAGRALLLITNHEEPSEAALKCQLLDRSWEPQYILADEKKDLDALLRSMDIKEWPWPQIEVRKTNDAAVPPFFARPYRSFCLSLTTFLLIACACFLILRKINNLLLEAFQNASHLQGLFYQASRPRHLMEVDSMERIK